MVLATSGCGAQGVVRPASWVDAETVANIGSGDCVVLASGRVRCAAEQLDRLASGLLGVERVSSGAGGAGYPRCAVTHDGRAACWGCATRPGEYAPPAFQPLTGVVQVVAGRSRACALLGAGGVRCWGDRFGAFQPYDATMCLALPSERFEIAEPFPPVRRIAMTTDGRLCGLTAAGSVLCDGVYEPVTDPLMLATSQPMIGALGPGTTAGVKRMRLPPARDIVAGDDHFCSLGMDGSVTCWDENSHGQVGAPTELCVEYVSGGCKLKPTRVRLDAPAIAVAAGAEHSCAVLDDGGVACWGNNPAGALGFESSEVCHPNFRGFCNPVPERVAGIGEARQIAASRGGMRTWVLTDDGDLLTWPEGVRGPRDERRPIGPCANVASALTEQQLLSKADQLVKRRVRVRGVVTPSGRLGILHLTGSSMLRVGEEGIVDGQLLRLHDGSVHQHSFGIHAYDSCLTP